MQQAPVPPQPSTPGPSNGGRIQIYTEPQQFAVGAASRTLHARKAVDAGATGWTNTGLPVLAGDMLTFTATGTLQLAGHTITPDGMTRGWRDMLRQFPVDTANAGALVGRVGDSDATVPFVVGSQATLDAAQTGNLFLRVNTSTESAATGTVQVDIQVKPATAPTNTPAIADAFTALTPAVLDALPRRVADRDGTPGDATNFALLGTEQQVRGALARAGWVEVDANTGAALVHGLLNTLQHKPYVEVPMSTLYLFGRTQDLSFARASAITVATERHHLRCWKTEAVVGGTPLWIGAATHDIGLERDQRSGQMTHRIAAAIDLERDFLRDTFQGSGTAAAIAYFTPLSPVRNARTATGGSFNSDGRTLLVRLR